MQRWSRRRLVTLGSSVAVFALASAFVAAQSGPGSTNALLPYHGYLESGGVAVSTPVDLRIGLFSSSAEGSAACLSGTSLSGCGVWADEMLNVPVSDGRFSVVLGSGLALSDDVFASDTLYVGVAVAPPGGSYAVLAGMQRLASVPYAVRTETAPDLYVGRSIGVGTSPDPATAIHVEEGDVYVRDDDNDATADIAQFFAHNRTQGIGIGYNTIEAVGSNAVQGIVLRPKASSVAVEGGLDVTGSATVRGTLLVEDGLLEPVIRNRDGTTSVYYREGGRYLVEATYQAANPTRRTTQIPESVLLAYCGDEDGCTVRLGMRDWTASTSSSTSAGPYHFAYGPGFEAGSTRHWRMAGGAEGHDGNGVVTHVHQEFDCYFTDGSYPPGGGAGNDSARGMGLLNYNASSGAYAPDCWLIIDD